MDLDGLEKLVNAHHGELMGKLATMELCFKRQSENCCKRMELIEEDVEQHDKTLERSKGMTKAIGAIWAAVCAIAACLAPYFWR